MFLKPNSYLQALPTYVISKRKMIFGIDINPVIFTYQEWDIDFKASLTSEKVALYHGQFKSEQKWFLCSFHLTVDINIHKPKFGGNLQILFLIHFISISGY